MENIWGKLSNDLAEVSAAAGKSVVAVHGTRHPSSGIVIAKDAVVAASHAVRRDDEITVITAPGQKLSARVAGRDPSTDLVVLRLQQPIEAQPCVGLPLPICASANWCLLWRARGAATSSPVPEFFPA